MSAELIFDSAGGACLQGRLDFSTVPEVWPKLAEWLAGERSPRLSLGGVDSANSAGLALLLEAREVAAARGRELQITDLPDELEALAGLSNLAFRNER